MILRVFLDGGVEVRWGNRGRRAFLVKEKQYTKPCLEVRPRKCRYFVTVECRKTNWKSKMKSNVTVQGRDD